MSIIVRYIYCATFVLQSVLSIDIPNRKYGIGSVASLGQKVTRGRVQKRVWPGEDGQKGCGPSRVTRGRGL